MLSPIPPCEADAPREDQRIHLPFARELEERRGSPRTTWAN